MKIMNFGWAGGLHRRQKGGLHKRVVRRPAEKGSTPARLNVQPPQKIHVFHLATRPSSPLGSV